MTKAHRIKHYIDKGMKVVDFTKSSMTHITRLVSEVRDLDDTVSSHPWVKHALGHLGIGGMKKIRDSIGLVDSGNVPHPSWSMYVENESAESIRGKTLWRDTPAELVEFYSKRKVFPTLVTFLILFPVTNVEAKQLIVQIGRRFDSVDNVLSHDPVGNLFSYEVCHMARTTVNDPWECVENVQHDGSAVIFDTNRVLPGVKRKHGQINVPFPLVMSFVRGLASHSRGWSAFKHDSMSVARSLISWFDTGKRPSWWSAKFAARMLKDLVDDSDNPATVGSTPRRS